MNQFASFRIRSNHVESDAEELIIACSASIQQLHGSLVELDPQQLQSETEEKLRSCCGRCLLTMKTAINFLIENFDHQSSFFDRRASYLSCCGTEVITELQRCSCLAETFGFRRLCYSDEDIGELNALVMRLENMQTVHFNVDGMPPNETKAVARKKSIICLSSCVCVQRIKADAA